jgi:beta-lactamase regulating signal transducer with metallopeptidase domain/predicted  nucleic acid-binding Zn-ribbon protein
MPLLLLVVKASVVLLSALGAAGLLGRSAASTRHRVWSVAFALILAVPALARVMPSLNVTLPAIQQEAPDIKGSEGQSSISSSTTFNVADPSITVSQIKGLSGTNGLHGPSLPFMAEMTWALGCVAALGLLALSLFRVQRLSRDSDELIDDEWQSSTSSISARFGLSPAPRLIVSERVTSPMAGGLFRPTVFLPSGAQQWEKERRDVVLTHEIAHLASRDPLRHLLVRIGVACYWFHPLAWLAAHRATVCREQACDEAVLAAGTRPSAYARVLLELAESLGSGAAPITALPMAQRSNLEKRVMTILNNDVRRSSARVWQLAAVGLAAVTLSVAAARPFAAAIDTPSATVIDKAPAAVTPASVTAIADPRTAPAPIARVSSSTAICRWNRDDAFSGTSSISGDGMTMMIGRSGTQTIVQRSFDGLRVCMVADGIADRVDRPAQMLERAAHVVMSAERDGQSQQLEITRAAGGARTAWRVNGKERQVDAGAEEWRRSMLAVLDATWESAQIRGEVSSLRGEISSIRGEESSLRGQISSVRGQVSSYNGRISSVRGNESSLRGEISAIDGELSSLRGQISSEQGAISSLESRRDDAPGDERRSIDARIAEHRQRIDEIHKQIDAFDAAGKRRDVEKTLDSFNADQKVRDLQKTIDGYNADAKVREIEQQIAALKVGDKQRELEKQIASLNADVRVEAIDKQLTAALADLRAAIAKIR